MKQIRISGLVRAADAVRRELPRAVTEPQRRKLRERIDASVREVREFLARHQATLEHLPAPSRRAMRFLESVDLTRRATSAPAEPPAVSALNSEPTVSWRGLGPFLERTLNRLATDLSAAEQESVRQAIERTSRQIELTIARRNLSPERLTPSSRAQRGWLALLSRADALTDYVRARTCAARVLGAAAGRSKRYGPPLKIHFRPYPGIYKLRRGPGGTLLSLPTPMTAFGEPAFKDLADLVYGDARDARRRVIEQMTGDGFQALRAELDALGGIADNARGAVHDLSAAFDRVNARYFGGSMPRPRLTWNRTFTGRKFGHYDWILDTVMVSRTLDTPTIPEFVVDYLVYHELLHKFHGLHWVNGRGYAHTTEFQNDERKFARYAEAEALLQRLARAAR